LVSYIVVGRSTQWLFNPAGPDRCMALMGLLAMHARHRMLTRPVNNFRREGADLRGLVGGFFPSEPVSRTARASAANPDWTILRGRWEHSHVARAVLAVRSLILVTAVAL
jgi:hypothetical protein